MLRTSSVCHVASFLVIFCILVLGIPEGAAIAEVPTGHIASHGLERDAVNADGTGEGVGYFTFIEGIPGPFFAGPPSEATAFFTFRSEPFSTGVIPNGAVIALLHPPGRFTTYLNSVPQGNWNDFPTPLNASPPFIFSLGFTSFAIGGNGDRADE